jgi:hypothetical protein
MQMVSMAEQPALTFTATSIGFISAVFFCIGNAMNTSDKILLQATLFWDFIEPVARALAAQRAQCTVGALRLIIHFFFNERGIPWDNRGPCSLICFGAKERIPL